MIDPTLIAQANDFDPLALAERYTTLKRKSGKEYCGPCPVCKQGKDCFNVQPAARRWLCRKCTEGKWRDVIALYIGITGATFADAVNNLTGRALPPAPTRRVEPPSEQPTEPPGPQWQARARELVAEAESCLWSDDGVKARAWLNARGLADETLRRWHVGYIPKHHERGERATDWEVIGRKTIRIERGILLPCIGNGTIWYLKVRRPIGNPKYRQVPGGQVALFMADTLTTARQACITEGEFDAMLLWQCLQHATSPRWRNLGVATLGSKSNRFESERCIGLVYWTRYLVHLRHIIIMLDQDGESEDAKAYWRSIAGRAFIHRWANIREGDKDLTDFHLGGGRLLDLASFGVIQAEYADPPEPPEAVTGFLADVGLTVTGIHPEGDYRYCVEVAKLPETIESQGSK